MTLAQPSLFAEPEMAVVILDPRLTDYERDALARLLVSAKRGGEGYHRESVDAYRVRRVLETGTTETAADEDLLNFALVMQERAQRSIAPWKGLEGEDDGNCRPDRHPGISSPAAPPVQATVP